MHSLPTLIFSTNQDSSKILHIKSRPKLWEPSCQGPDKWNRFTGWYFKIFFQGFSPKSVELIRGSKSPFFLKFTRWGAPSVFAGGRLRAPWPPTLHRKGVYFYTDPNLVSLCSDHFCTCRKKNPIKIYAF